MKPESLEVTKGLDRLATSDEIRTALEPFREFLAKGVREAALEIPSDLGGYVRVTAEEFEMLTLIEDLTR